MPSLKRVDPALLFETVKGPALQEESRNTSCDGEREPTAEELQTLRRISGKIPWQAMTVTFVEFCERFYYYGTTAVFANFLQQPRPYGSRTGAINETQACMTFSEWMPALSPVVSAKTFNSFWAYLMPLVGGYIADTYLGRFMTIQIAIAAAILGHVVLIVSVTPSVMDHLSGTLGCFAVGLIIMGLGTGGFKSNISPLLAEQVKETRPRVVTLKGGERVIEDPTVTVSRVFLYFYMMINLGSLAGGIGMVYVERYVGFWLAYALPTFLFFTAPIVLMLCKKQYNQSPPTGSVLSKAFALLALASKGCWHVNPAMTYKNLTRKDFWNDVKPSRLGDSAPAWMSAVDDAWVEQVARGFNACKVFFWMPLYWLAYNQMVNNLTSQSATMVLNGVPNDLINNLNPILLVIMIPIMDTVIYPGLRKTGIRFNPIKRITFGFLVASAAMIPSTVMQYYIYKLSPCPNSEVSTGTDCTAPINVWTQAVPYVLIGFSEIFASITTLEYAFSKAPENMRGLVVGVNLFQNAFSAALGQALVPLSADPLLVWNYGIVAVLAFVGGVGFWFTWKELDSREDELNMIQATKYKGRGAALQENEKV